MKKGELDDSHTSTDKWNAIINKAQKFLDKTQEHALQGVNPGGVYHHFKVQRCTIYSQRLVSIREYSWSNAANLSNMVPSDIIF
jgi:hypothetical protein